MFILRGCKHVGGGETGEKEKIAIDRSGDVGEIGGKNSRTSMPGIRG